VNGHRRGPLAESGSRVPASGTGCGSTGKSTRKMSRRCSCQPELPAWFPGGRADHPDVPEEQAWRLERCEAAAGVERLMETITAAVRRLCRHGHGRGCYVHCHSVGRYGEGRMPTGLSGTRLPARRAHATASARGRHIRDASDRQPGAGWSSRLTRRRWAAAGAAVAVMALCGAATIVMLHQPAGKAPARVASCGLVACDVLPSATAAARATARTPRVTPARTPRVTPARAQASPSPAASSPAAGTAPTPLPSCRHRVRPPRRCPPGLR
jgi:hypothetical protein